MTRIDVFFERIANGPGSPSPFALSPEGRGIGDQVALSPGGRGEGEGGFSVDANRQPFTSTDTGAASSLRNLLPWPPRSILVCDAGNPAEAPKPASRIAGVADVPLDAIKSEDIIKHVVEISDDRYEGRDSPSPGLDIAAAYIRNVAAGNGLAGANAANEKDPFLQPFKLYGYTRIKLFREKFKPRTDGRKPEAYGPRLFEYAIHEDELRSRRKKADFEKQRYYEWGAVNNVAGILEGSDPVLKDRYVIVSAHYDHIGKKNWGGDKIYNGADDNASGVSVLLSLLPVLAKMKAEGRGPKRSIVFLWTAAEEKGLLGADFYRRNPLKPLDKTVAAMNLDMIGRLSDSQISVIDSDREGKANFFHDLHDEAARIVDFKMIDHDIDDYIDRQDGGVWVDAGIPTLFMFEGFAPDGRLNPDYHGVNDEVPGIMADNGGTKIERVARMTLLMLLGAANR